MVVFSAIAARYRIDASAAVSEKKLFATPLMVEWML